MFGVATYCQDVDTALIPLVLVMLGLHSMGLELDRVKTDGLSFEWEGDWRIPLLTGACGVDWYQTVGIVGLHLPRHSVLRGLYVQDTRE